MELKENERIDDLACGNLKIIQNKTFFCFGIDSVLLANFAKDIKKDSVVLDLGTGNGILPLLLSEKTMAKKLVGIEIQKELVDLAKRNVLLNHLENKIDIVQANIKELEGQLEKHSFDVVITNPPYKKSKTGMQNENTYKLIARHEVEANLEDFICASHQMLKDRGTLYLIHRTERLPDIMVYLRKYQIEPKELQFIQDTPKDAPQLVLVKAVQYAHAFLKIKPTICVRTSPKESEE